MAIAAGRVEAPGDGAWLYTVEGEVEDVNRQTVAGRVEVPVHPAAFYVGLRTPTGFMKAGTEYGLDTVVGERGAQVSGGERQRLALAAALLRRPEVFILDEATSAVDVQTEGGILQRLRGAFPRSMIVIIAHRAESLSLCDRVFTLVNGRLVGVAERARASGSPAATARSAL